MNPLVLERITEECVSLQENRIALCGIDPVMSTSLKAGKQIMRNRYFLLCDVARLTERDIILSGIPGIL